MIACHTRRIVASAAMCMALTAVAASAQESTPSYEVRFELSQIKIDESGDVLARWQRDQQLALAFVVLVALLGVATTMLQVFRQKPWSALATGIVGALVTGFTALNAAVIPADYNTLTKRVDEGEVLVKRMRNAWSVGMKVTAAPDKDEMLKEISTTLASFQTLAAGERGTTAAAALPSFTATLHAQTDADCSCSAMLDRKSTAFVYSCGTASQKSLTAARAEAQAKAVGAMAARLQPGQSAQQRAGDASVDYVRRVATLADSCASVGKDGSLAATVLMRMPASLADKNAQRAFTTSAAPSPARVAQAAGEVPFPAQAANRIQVPVRATPAKYGDFLFTFAVRPGNPRILQLEDIRVTEDGSAGSTSWSFSILFDGSVVGTIPSLKYSDDQRPPTYRVPSTIAWPSNRPLRLKILGYKP
jgi:hypothetical protein